MQLMSAFKDMLQEDELNFNFDYCHFLRSCSELLDKVSSKFDIDCATDASTAYRSVNIILWEAAATEKQIPLAPKMENTMLYQSAITIQAYLTMHGSAEVESARLKCGGELPLETDAGKPNLAMLFEGLMKVGSQVPEAKVLTDMIQLGQHEDIPPG